MSELKNADKWLIDVDNHVVATGLKARWGQDDLEQPPYNSLQHPTRVTEA